MECTINAGFKRFHFLETVCPLIMCIEKKNTTLFSSYRPDIGVNE